MTAEYGAFSRPTFTADDFEREEVESDTPMFAAPIYAQRAASRRGGPSPAVIGAGVLALALAAGAGVYLMNQQGETTVASTKPVQVQVAPAATPAPSEMAANTVQPVNPAPAMAPETPKAPAATSPRVSGHVAPTHTARARTTPEAASAATATGVDASATLPASPQPYAPSTSTPPAPAPEIAPTAPTVQAQPVNPEPQVTQQAPAPTVPDDSTAPPKA